MLSSKVSRITVFGSLISLMLCRSSFWLNVELVPEPRRILRCPMLRSTDDESSVYSGKFEKLEQELAHSKFSDKGVLTYRKQNGEELFAIKVQPKLETPAARPRDG